MASRKRRQARGADTGWSTGGWCRDIGFSRQTYWRLPHDRKPLTAHVGGIVRIVEPPADWLKRIAAAGPVKLQKAAA